jgi:hypothetical protein|tara:strand:- start:568 stop:693 length:126 start_codon:yes stop_codon:yes gene_type:complete
MRKMKKVGNSNTKAIVLAIIQAKNTPTKREMTDTHNSKNAI